MSLDRLGSALQGGAGSGLTARVSHHTCYALPPPRNSPWGIALPAALCLGSRPWSPPWRHASRPIF
eukprot:3833501-Heterocapsa_arctica.AAC.1